MTEFWKEIEEGAIISHDIKKSPKNRRLAVYEAGRGQKSCLGYGLCFEHCPEAAIDYDSERKADIDFDICKGCGVCATVCPQKAIKMQKN